MIIIIIITIMIIIITAWDNKAALVNVRKSPQG